MTGYDLAAVRAAAARGIAAARDRGAKFAIFLVCQFAHVLASLWMLAAILTGSDRYWRIARGYDRVGNAATGGLDTETVSSRASRARKEGRRWGCVLCKLLDRIEPDHCSKSEGV